MYITQKKHRRNRARQQKPFGSDCGERKGYYKREKILKSDYKWREKEKEEKETYWSLLSYRAEVKTLTELSKENEKFRSKYLELSEEIEKMKVRYLSQ